MVSGQKWVVLINYCRSAQTPAARSTQKLNFVCWHLSMLGTSVRNLLPVALLRHRILKLFREFCKIYAPLNSINQQSQYSAAEHRASTRFLHCTLFLATHLISVQVFFTPLASSSTVLRHVFFGLPLIRFPWAFHSRACLVISSVGFRSAWPSHPHLCLLICKSILGCLLRFHSSLCG